MRKLAPLIQPKGKVIDPPYVHLDPFGDTRDLIGYKRSTPEWTIAKVPMLETFEQALCKVGAEAFHTLDHRLQRQWKGKEFGTTGEVLYGQLES